ncbi:MAG TPA: type II toxin-antitoxin system RelE/ParE family toxin [Blastocatellia bacterium]|nr:type II toxin-antitoxin system RelE/ParE family toxin [Blastocatellia bacterium]
MITSFHHKGLKDFWEKGGRKGIPPSMASRIERVLDALDAATDVSQLNLPGFNLHQLKGDRKGGWSIWVSANYRITFRFKQGDAHDVNLEDYH